MNRIISSLTPFTILSPSDYAESLALASLIENSSCDNRNLYKELASKLGDKNFIFGDEPCLLDAILYNHLAAHCLPRKKQHFIDTFFKNSLSVDPMLFSLLTFEYPSLIRYCTRIDDIVKDFKYTENIETWSSYLQRISGWSNDKYSGLDEKQILKLKSDRLESFSRIFSVVLGISAFLLYSSIFTEVGDEEYEE